MFRVSVDSLIFFPQSFFFIIIWIVSLMLISQGILPMSRKREKERENNFLLFLSDDHQFDWRDALSVPEKENSAKTFLLFGFFFLRLVCYGSHIGRRWTSCPEYEWKKREISLISFLFSLVATFFFSYIHFLIKIRLYCTIAMPKPFFFGGGGRALDLLLVSSNTHCKCIRYSKQFFGGWTCIYADILISISFRLRGPLETEKIYTTHTRDQYRLYYMGLDPSGGGNTTRI